MKYNYGELCVQMIVLFIFYNVIYYFPPLQKYTDDTRFNVYRSLMCIAFSYFGVHIGLNFFKHGLNHPFSFRHAQINEVQYIFMAYLVLDVIKIIASNPLKEIRPDLLVHHILCILGLLAAHHSKQYGYMHIIILIAESLSIVSGVDAMAIEDDNKYLSYQCKKFRRRVLKYIRMPIWILIIMYTLKYINRSSSIVWYHFIISTVLIIFLDYYWLQKCNKVIKMYESN
jgi:hypothetical protein